MTTEERSSDKRLPILLVSAALGGGLILAWWSAGVAADLDRWTVIFDEMEVDLPASASIMRDNLGFDKMALRLGAVGWLVWCVVPIALAVRYPQAGRLRCLWAVASLALLVAGALGVAVTQGFVTAEYVENMELTSLPTAKSLPAEAARLTDSSASDADRMMAAQPLRALGLMKQVGLVEDLDAASIEKLATFAADDDKKIRFRYFAAWALLVLDRESPSSKAGIRDAILAAAESDDEQLRERGLRYIVGHPLFAEGGEE